MIALVLAVVQHWLVVNDIHLNPFSDTGIVYGSDTSPTLWKSALRAMRADVPEPRVVLLGGDLLSHHFSDDAHDVHENAVASSERTAQTIATDLNEIFPHAQFLVAQGNNDDPCGDYRSETESAYQQRIAAIWAPLVNRNGVAPDFVADFARGGYYTARLPIRDGLAIVLNSVFWSFINRNGCLSNTRNAGSNELAWLRTELSDLAPGTNAVMLMHIPPGFDPQSTSEVHRLIAVPFLSPSADRAFLDDIAAHPASLRFIVGAHTHRYDFRIVEGIPMLIASSISPIYDNNPAFYRLDVDENGILLDVQPFVYDPETNAWERERSFDAMYGVTNFTRSSLEAIAASIRSGGDRREAWRQAYHVWAPQARGIGTRNWIAFACAQTELDGSYASCAGTTNRTTKAVLAAAIALALALFAVWFFLRRRDATRAR